MILDQLKEDMKAALKSGDKVRLGVVRMLISELKNARIAAKEELSQQEEEKILASYAKKRKESIEKYMEGGRKDLADKEEKEYEITVSYLPKQLGEDELATLIQKHIDELGAAGKKDFGRVMKPVMEDVGSRAEGAKVSAMLREMLDG
jgi:uncharacterized protein YqeY